jgi:ATP-dependent helicase HrpB
VQEHILPIQQIGKDVLKSILEFPISILSAPPGAGKSTWLPYYIQKELNLLNGKILLLEPRRLAAKSVAKRLSELYNEECGESVGYKVRFESNVSEFTKIEVVTEGVFLNYILADNLLEGISLIIFDEFHERNLQSDLALSLSLQLQQILRPDLKILIMSATLDIDELKRVLPEASVLKSEGRMYPVNFHYLKEEEQLLNLNLIAAHCISVSKITSGDILVFLPGAWEINKLFDLIENSLNNFEIHKLYGELSINDQQLAIYPSPKGKRKIVLSTSIAETSLTIEGITTVIDSGWMRIPQFDKNAGLNKLITQRVTKDAAIQRAGRAGRLSEGNCFRIYTEATYNRLIDKRKPEIISADLSTLFLTLARWGSININDYIFITKPDPALIKSTINLLESIDAIINNKITEHGIKLNNLPTHPRLANMLLYAQSKKNPDLLLLAIDLIAIIEERDPIKESFSIDIWQRLNELHKFRNKQKIYADITIINRIEHATKWWVNYFNLKKHYLLSDVEFNTGELLSRAFPDRIAKRTEQNIYKLSNGIRVSLPLNDELTHFDWLIITSADAREGIGKAFMGSSVELESILPLSKEIKVVSWNDKNNKPESLIRTVIGQNIICEKINKEISAEQLQFFLINRIKEIGIKIFDPDENFKQLQGRVQFLINTNNLNWKTINNENLINNIEEWLCPFIGSANSIQKIKELNITDLVLNWLGYQEQIELNKLAPSFIEVPTGSKIKVDYLIRPNQPILEVRLQEIFGWIETPLINNGKTKLLIHLLSPGYKPVQITQDLKSFWENGYHEVKKELKQRYPKHSWPDDPLKAEPVRGIKKK